MKPSVIFHKKAFWWIVIILAVGLGLFFLWPTSVSQTDVFIPVKPINIPEGLALSPPFPKGIEIRVSGPTSIIKKIADHSYEYTLDLSSVDEGHHSIPINNDAIRLSSNITIVKITPSFLAVAIEKEKLKIVPIKVSLSGKPAAGYRVSKMSVSPASVTLQGPKSLLDPISQVQTKPVDVNGAHESFKKETTLDLAEGISTSGSLEVIPVEITILEKVEIRNIHNVPVRGLQTQHSYRISPDTIDVTVKGPVNALDKLDAEETINVHIDLTDLPPGMYMKPATILLPVGITLIQVEPKTFTVEILNESSETE